MSVVEEKDQQNVLERAEELSITVEHKVPAMEVECSERERGETLLTAEHLKITGALFAEVSFDNIVVHRIEIIYFKISPSIIFQPSSARVECFPSLSLNWLHLLQSKII